MRAFADLYAALDQTTKTNEKVAALVSYFRAASASDAAWAIYFLSGRKPRQVVPYRKLVGWAIDEAKIPEWLYLECLSAVGDVAETIALLLPEATTSSGGSLAYWVEQRLLPLRDAGEEFQHSAVIAAWNELDHRQRFVFNKLITSEFRVGVSQQLVTRALASVSSLDQKVVAHRLMGSWEPTAAFYAFLASKETGESQVSHPYPFFLAHPLDGEPDVLGDIRTWQAEWKWDGIRAQVIKRQGQAFIWSRGEELVTDRYPEVREAIGLGTDGIVLDGELLPWKDGVVQPFAQMQRRIGRKTLGKKLLAEIPVVLLAFDLIEFEGLDVRERPLSWRRMQLSETVASIGHPSLLLSPRIDADSWSSLATVRAESRERHVEGIMLKRLDSPYRVGRQRGDWWKWKISPYTVDAVLIYAQPGSGKRASLFTDYTFGVWSDTGELIPFAKAYSGLTDEEIREVDAFVRRNTIERYGPVRTVKPELVFELAFEGIQRSTRHKSGIAVRFPRISRWRQDKPASQADSLETIRALLPG
jgi:DNA ligase 1